MRDYCSEGGDAGRGKKIDERTDSNPSFFFARKSERIGHSEEEKRRKEPDSFGDEYVVVKIAVPKKLSEAERTALENYAETRRAKSGSRV